MIYFDNSATTRIHPDALETYNTVSKTIFGNPSSLHKVGENAQALLTQSRKQIAELIDSKVSEIYFTSGGTEGDNWAIKGTALEKSEYGKHIITSSIEHSAVTNGMKQLERMGFEVTYLPVNAAGQVNPEDLKKEIRSDTILVSIMAVNNEVGAVQPLEGICHVLEDHPQIHFHVDAVQTPGKISFSLDKLDRIDLAVFSSHKFQGPKGVGFMYIKEGRRIQPLLSGGGQESNRRSGTENVPGIAAMAKALRLTMETFEENEIRWSQLNSKVRESLAAKEGVTVFSPADATPFILCFGIEGIRGEVLVHALEDQEIYVSTTSACSSRSQDISSTLSAMQVSKNYATSAIRLSFNGENTKEEIDQFLQVFDEVYTKFSKVV